MKKLRHERDGYKDKLNDYKTVITPSLSERSGYGYEPVPPCAVESGRGGYESVPASALESGRSEYQHLSPSAVESGRAERVELSGTEGRVPVFVR